MKWIHNYYIKGNKLDDLVIPTQACWIVRKVLGAEHDLYLLHNNPGGKRSGIREA